MLNSARALSRALVVWLKDQGGVTESRFWGELDRAINNPIGLIAVGTRLAYSPLDYMTLPLETIALAAACALGITWERNEAASPTA